MEVHITGYPVLRTGFFSLAVEYNFFFPLLNRDQLKYFEFKLNEQRFH